MRLPLALCIALALSGCIQLDFSDEAKRMDAQDADAPEAQARPQVPTRIVERIDLRQGLPETTWTMEVAPGYTEGRVVARIEGPEGVPQFTSTGYCYRFEGKQDDGSSFRTSGGVGCDSGLPSFTSGSPRDMVHLEGGDFGSGWYRLRFSAGPSVGFLVLELVADYGHGASGADHDAHA